MKQQAGNSKKDVGVQIWI